MWRHFELRVRRDCYNEFLGRLADWKQVGQVQNLIGEVGLGLEKGVAGVLAFSPSFGAQFRLFFRRRLSCGWLYAD
jgi:hypothetical protein